LLRAGLLRVQRNATRFAETIPLDSLTDCVLDNQVTNAVWTAWRTLDRKPRSEHPSPDAGRPMIKIRPTVDPPPLAAIGAATPAAAAMYPLGAGSGERPRADDVAADADSSGAAAADRRADILLLAPLVTAAQTLIAEYGPTALPAHVPLTPARDLDDLLAQLQPEAISAASGLPLARTEDGLEQLRRRVAEDTGSVSGTPAAPLPPVQREILQYAFAKGRPRTGPSTSREAMSDAAGYADPPPTAVEAVVGGLRTEEDRLRHRASNADWVREGGDPGTARKLAARLQSVADQLLKRADFVALTDPDEHLICGNGAFDDLVAQPVEASLEGERRQEQRQRNVASWERGLAGQPPGHSIQPAPAANRIASVWELWRSVLTDAADGRLHAYLNVLRGRDAPGPLTGALERVKSALPEVQKFTSLVAYGSGDHRDEYIERLLVLTASMETAVTDA
jgi:hypothetical protein